MRFYVNYLILSRNRNLFLLLLAIHLFSACKKEPAAPTADFTSIVTSGKIPLSIDFTDLSINTPTAWEWNFGDGNISTSQNPSHIYNTQGTYMVTLTASNAGGSDVKTKNEYITAEKVYGIIAGDTNSCTMLSINDDIYPQYELPPYKLDFNRDNVDDIEIISYYYWWYGGYCSTYYCKIEGINNTQILLDLSPVNRYCNDDTILSFRYNYIPKIINQNEVINYQGQWSDSTIEWEPCEMIEFSRIIFCEGIDILNGWSDLGYKFMGFRTICENDTIYGWVQLKVSGYNHINIINGGFK